MSTCMRRWPASVRRNLCGIVLLSLLLGAASCDGPIAPTTCMDACMQPATQCVVLTTGAVSGPAACNKTYEECKAKCR